MLIFIFSSLWFRHSSFDVSLSFPGPETPTCEAYTFRAKPATSLVPHLWGRPYRLSPPCDHSPQSLPLGFWGLFSPGKMVPCALVKSTSLLVHVVCLQKKRKLESGLLSAVPRLPARTVPEWASVRRGEALSYRSLHKGQKSSEGPVCMEAAKTETKDGESWGTGGVSLWIWLGTKLSWVSATVSFINLLGYLIN